MNLSTKTMPWMVASLLAATSVFGQNQSQGACAPQQCVPQPPVCKPAKCCVPQNPLEPKMCAYNAPAEINVGCQGDIDFWASGSFLYWQPSQDNMAIGYTDNNVFLGLPLGTPEATFKGSFIEMDFDFKPGFKAGLGMNLQTDDWWGYVEYTRVHGTHSTFSNGPLASPCIFNTFGHPFLGNSTLGGGQAYNTASGHYRNNLDFIDAEMGRTYYVGKSLIFESVWGARGAWILQNIHARYNNLQSVVSHDPTGVVTSLPSVLDVYQRSHSWAVGPRTGLTMDWMLGSGVRFFGSGFADILYTKYKVQDKSVLMPRISNGSLLVGNPVSIIGHDKVSVLRTHLDLEMGFGWGSYFDNNAWHVDLSASYGWQVFFDQNMFRLYTSGTSIGTNIVPQGNLYVQGLTITARVDF